MHANSVTWKTSRVKDLSTHITVGFVGSMSSLFMDEGVPLLRGQNIRPYQLDLTNIKYISAETHRKWKKSALQPGDVVIVRVGYPGTACVIPKGLGDLNAASLVIVRPDTKLLDSDFLCYVLNSPWGKARVQARLVGAAQQVFNTHTAAELEIPAPPLPMQRRIAGILSAYDELVENSQKRIRILEAVTRTLYREWFINLRFPDNERMPLVNSPVGRVPKDWEVKRLGEIADIFRGRSYRSIDLVEEGGLPFLNLKCLDRDGGFRRSGLKRYKGEYKDSHVAKKGDIVMGVTDMTQERRIVARAALVPTLDKEFGIASMDLVRIEPMPPVPKPFLYSFLRYSSFADEVKQHANGANVLHLAPERITDYRFAVPTVDLMRRFSALVGPTLVQIDVLQNRIELLRRTRNLLLPQLLSGLVNLEVD